MRDIITGLSVLYLCTNCALFVH